MTVGSRSPRDLRQRRHRSAAGRGARRWRRRCGWPGATCVLWAREAEVAAEINASHANTAFLPGVPLDAGLRATAELADIAALDVVLMVAPAQHVRAVAGELAAHLPRASRSSCAPRGSSRRRASCWARCSPRRCRRRRRPCCRARASPPTWRAACPRPLTLATADEALGEALATALGYRNLRIYWSSDTVGVQLGGAVKNVLAIAAGIVDGKGLGASAHAALVTRGFAELRRFGEALGARPETLMGLSGLGDLLLTCGSPQSRNMSLGRALGQGQTLARRARQPALGGGGRLYRRGRRRVAAREGRRHADLPGRARHRRGQAHHRRRHRGPAVAAAAGGGRLGRASA